MLHEISQTKRKMLFDLTHMWNPKNKQKPPEVLRLEGTGNKT
jgi:hypothetical protein